MNATTMQARPVSAGRCPAWCESPVRGGEHAHYRTVGVVSLDPSMPAGADVDLWPSVQVELVQRPGEDPRVSVATYMCADEQGDVLDLDQAAELYRALGEALALARTEAAR